LDEDLIEGLKLLLLKPVDRSKLSTSFFIVSLLSCFLFSNYHLLSQTDSILVVTPSNQSIDYGFKKLANTISFYFNGILSVKSSLGTVDVSQQYSGTGIRVITTAFRDDQNLVIRYSKEIVPTLSLIGKYSWILSADSRSIELNKLERQIGLGGLQFSPINTWTTTAMVGYEKNNQLGIISNAFAFEGSSILQPIVVENYLFQGTVRTDYFNLDSLRTNSDINVDVFSERDFQEGNIARFFTRYRRLQRDFFTPVGSSFEDLIVETRVENRFSVGTDLQIKLLDLVSSQLQFSIDQAEIPRGFRSSIARVPQTSIVRSLQELQFNGQGLFQFAYKNYTQSVWIQYFSRKEENKVTVAFPLLSIEEVELRKSEFNRDNNSLRLRVGTDLNTYFSTEDTIRFSSSIGILRYNTPSELNRDDRDEQTVITTMVYGKRISEYANIQYFFTGQSTHLVYLKKERSSLNNVNSILKLGTNFFVKSNKFTSATSLELLANYTVYDFEVPEQVRSFSFRQLLFRDSTTFSLSPKYFIEARAYIRYFERGRLYWESFSELPELQSMETFIRLLIYTKPNDNLLLGFGSRFYSMQQKNLLIRNALSSDISQSVPGPEVDIRYILPNNSYISLSGWYEFQRTNGILTRELPNVTLNSLITF